MLDGGRFEVLVEIGSATRHGSGVPGYLRVNSFPAPQLQQESNSLSGDLGGRLPRLSRLRAQFLMQFLRQRDMEIPFRSSHTKTITQKMSHYADIIFVIELAKKVPPPRKNESATPKKGER